MKATEIDTEKLAKRLRVQLRLAKGIRQHFMDRVEHSGRCGSLVYQLYREIRSLYRAVRRAVKLANDSEALASMAKWLMGQSLEFRSRLARIENRLFLV